jgi:hypothetical protein
MLVRLDDLDLTDPAVRENWYLAYDTLRDQAPVWRSPSGDYVLTRYREVHLVLRQSRLADLRLTPGANDFSHQPGFVLRALRSLHISFRSA